MEGRDDIKKLSKIFGAEVTLKAIVFWDVTLDSLVEISVPFGGTWWLHLPRWVL